MENKKEIIFYRESYLQSLMSDITTFGLLTLMMAFNYFYLGNNAVSATIFFIVFILFTIGNAQIRKNTFTSKEELIEYLQNHD